MRSIKWLAVAGLGAALGCNSLDVTNPNNPDRDRALARPGDVESLIGTQFTPIWGVMYGSLRADEITGNSCAMETCPAATLSTIADHFSSSWGNAGMRFLSIEPREPYNNSSGYTYRAINQYPWYELYSTISNVNDGLRALNGGLSLPGGRGADSARDVPRARAFAHIIQGMAHGYLGLMFDSAFVHVETDDPATHTFVLADYNTVRDTAIAMIRKGIAIADGPDDFETLPTWIRGVEMTDEDLSAFGHTLVARLMAYTPRSPAERAAVDWNAVLTELNSGIRDVTPVAEPNHIFQGYFRYYTTDDTWMRVDNKTVGPADTSGAFAAWIATAVASRQPFVVQTPDRRITDRSLDPSGETGRYFFQNDYDAFIPARGSYHQSFYSLIRFGSGPLNWGEEAVPILWITPAEVDLLKAEANIRLGNTATAATLINTTRTANGGLPLILPTGVVPGTGCVPRTANGTACGTIWDALFHEFRMELAGVEPGIAWYNARGWGTLVPGSVTMFPIPGRELEVLRKPLYSYGGNPGQPGSAP